MQWRRASQQNRLDASRRMMVRVHRSDEPLFPCAGDETLDLRLTAFEPLFAALAILQRESLEIAEGIENERSHFASDVRLFGQLVRFLLATEELEQGMPLEAAPPGASVPSR